MSFSLMSSVSGDIDVSFNYRAPQPSTISGTADSRTAALRDRHNIIKQTVLRNDHFSPSTLPGKDRDRLLNVGFLSCIILLVKATEPY